MNDIFELTWDSNEERLKLKNYKKRKEKINLWTHKDEIKFISKTK